MKGSLHPYLQKHFNKTLLYAAGVFLLGVLFCGTGLLSTNLYTGIIPTTVIALCLVLLAFWFRYTVIKNGFDTYSGTCIDIYSSSRIRKKMNYLLECDNPDYIELSAKDVKGNAKIPLGAVVTIYAPKGAKLFQIDGIYHLFSIYGYELSHQSKPFAS